jgi:hypothetical protein
VLALAGRREEAAATKEEALRLYEEKGATAVVQRLRAQTLPGPAPSVAGA